ncbi:hypothetical protein F511_33812 [Dorcoceras hygrometricum]|uniref:Uncharacterized protein n=1 Tax=Dorcoceras hygrometricum TaxID=472368 RepID=A0A2Z7C7L2_9LAMI|nr:hypothetical protein F511_33812 [Dorcoceras hygrometricum]
MFESLPCWRLGAWLRPISQETGTSKGRPAVDRLIRSTTGNTIPQSICTRRSDGFKHDQIILVKTIETSPITTATGHGGGAAAQGGARWCRRRREVGRGGGGRD